MIEIEDCKWKILARKKRDGNWYDMAFKGRPCFVISYGNAGKVFKKTVNVEILRDAQWSSDTITYDGVGNIKTKLDPNG